MVKMVQNYQKWSNGKKWSKMAKNGQKSPKSAKMVKITKKCPKWSNIVPNDSKWSQMVQIVKNGKKNGGTDFKRARRTGLSARRARRTKSRGPKGLQLEVGPRRGP